MSWDSFNKCDGCANHEIRHYCTINGTYRMLRPKDDKEECTNRKPPKDIYQDVNVEALMPYIEILEGQKEIKQ